MWDWVVATERLLQSCHPPAQRSVFSVRCHRLSLEVHKVLSKSVCRMYPVYFIVYLTRRISSSSSNIVHPSMDRVRPGVVQAMKNWEGRKISGAKCPKKFTAALPLFQFASTYWRHMPFFALPTPFEAMHAVTIMSLKVYRTRHCVDQQTDSLVFSPEFQSDHREWSH